MKNIIVGWGRSGVGNSWLIRVLSSMPIDCAEQVDDSFADIRIIMFTSVGDVKSYLDLAASGSRVVACRLPVYLINCRSMKQQDEIDKFMFEKGLRALARCPYLPNESVGVSGFDSVALTELKKMRELVAEVLYLKCSPGTLEFWRKRAFNIRNAIEFYFDNGEGERLRGLYVLVVEFDAITHAQSVSYWKALVARMVVYVRLVLACELKVPSGYCCSVFVMRELIREGSSQLTCLSGEEYSF